MNLPSEKDNAADSGQHPPLRRLAFVVGINDYLGSIPSLETAVPDARALAETLRRDHGYEVWLLVHDASASRIRSVLEEIRSVANEDSSLLFYFAGHGLALPSETGPEGYLIPADAVAAVESFIKMASLHEELSALPCRHVLAILDCCFAGAFRWASALGTRGLVPDGLMFRRTYELYLAGTARQVLVSASHDQEALEGFSGEEIRGRAVAEDTSLDRHSPFATALLAALSGRASIGQGGVLTVTSLSEYLRRQVEALSEIAENQQTPQLWPLMGHARGEYLFHLPGHALQLAENPKLTPDQNPYRGLLVYEAEHARIFHGRANVTATLLGNIEQKQFVILTGESGSGKSSLMRAAALPRLQDRGWKVLLAPDVSAPHKPPRPLRPGTTPLAELARLPRAPGSTLPAHGPLPPGGLARLMNEWLNHLDEDSHVLLPIDQFEELVSLGREVGNDTADQQEFQEQLAGVLRTDDRRLHILLTLRSDYAPDLASGILKPWWQRDALFPVPAITPLELRQIIQLPAAMVALDFANPDEVDFLVAEVAQTQNPLPILSCALSELYGHYIAANDGSRSMKLPPDFAQSGAVAGSLGRSGNKLRSELPDDTHRQMLDHVLVRFVSLEGGRAARRQVSKTGELEYSGAADTARQFIVRRLEEQRLIGSGQSDSATPCWELCHERLLIGWGHYRRLIQERQETILLQRRLATDMAARGKSSARRRWAMLRRAWGESLGGEHLWDKDPRLNQVLADLKKPVPWLNLAESKFVLRSRQMRRQRLLSIGLVAGGVLCALSLLGWNLQTSHNQRLVAERAKSMEESRRDAANAQELQSIGRANEAIAFLARALRTDPQNQLAADRAFNLLLQRNWILPLYKMPAYADFESSLDLSDDLSQLWPKRTVLRQLRNAENGRPVDDPLMPRIHDFDAPVYSKTLDDGWKGVDVVSAHGTKDGTGTSSLQIWNLRTLTPISEKLLFQGRVHGMDCALWKGKLYLANAEEGFTTWDLREGQARATTPVVEAEPAAGTLAPPWRSQSYGTPPEALRNLRFEDDQESDDNATSVVDSLSGALIAELDHGARIGGEALSTDGRFAVTAGRNDGRAVLWELPLDPAQKKARAVGQQMLSDRPFRSVDISLDNRLIAAASWKSREDDMLMADESLIQVWNAATQQPVCDPIWIRGTVESVKFTEHSRTLVVTLAGDEELGSSTWSACWDVSPGMLPPKGVPAWFCELLDLAAGQLINSSGSLETLSVEDRLKLADKLRAHSFVTGSPQDAFEKFASWFLQDRASRTVSPFSSQPMVEHLKKRVSDALSSSHLSEQDRAEIVRDSLLQAPGPSPVITDMPEASQDEIKRLRAIPYQAPEVGPAAPDE